VRNSRCRTWLTCRHPQVPQQRIARAGATARKSAAVDNAGTAIAPPAINITIPDIDPSLDIGDALANFPRSNRVISHFMLRSIALSCNLLRNEPWNTAALTVGTLPEINMLAVRNVLILLLCISPLCLFWDGDIVQGVFSGVAAVALAVTAKSLRPGETVFLASALRPALLAAAIPALWIVAQILPIGILAHPIWRSASTALAEPLLGRISIDPADSITSLGDYFLFAAVTFLSAAVAADRQRAAWMLSALTIVSTVISLIAIGHRLVFHGLAPFQFLQTTECISLGAIFAAANCVHAIERYGLRQHRPHALRQAWPTERQALIAGFASLAICGLALSLAAERHAALPAAYGLLTLVIVWTLRRCALGSWGAARIAIPVLTIVVLLIGSLPVRQALSIPLAFASTANLSNTALSQRMMDDAPAAGIGAGTFRNLAPVYREDKDPSPSLAPATAAAAFAIELGKPMLWLIVALTIGFALALLQASLRRGRDWLYPATAASGLVTTLLLTFVDAGLLGTATALSVSVMLGMGLAQSKSRTATSRKLADAP
jgi:hypothetical protein